MKEQLDLFVVLLDVMGSKNENYNPGIDVARLDAAEAIIKCTAPIEARKAAIVMLEAFTSGGVVASLRVRAAKILLAARAEVKS